MKCLLYTGEGLLVGWADVQVTDPEMLVIGGPFHPNDFYVLIHPTMSQFRWRHNVTLGEMEKEIPELGEDVWLHEFPQACEEIKGSAHETDYKAR